MIVAGYAAMDVLQQSIRARVLSWLGYQSLNPKELAENIFEALRGGLEPLQGLPCRDGPRPGLPFEHPALDPLLRLCGREVCEGQVILAFEVRPLRHELLTPFIVDEPRD